MRPTPSRDDEDRTVLVVMLVAGVALAAYMDYGVARFAAGVLGTRPAAPDAVLWQYVAAFVLFFAVPAAIWRLVVKRPLADVGLAVGDARFGLRFLAVAVPFALLPLVWLGARMPDVRAEYPLSRGADGAPVCLAWLEAAYLLYYVGWEFLFRGCLVLGLRERVGDVAAVGVSTLVSTAIHLGKPQGEVWGALIVGVLFGWLTIRTRSILWPFVLHATIGILTDVLVFAGRAP